MQNMLTVAFAFFGGISAGVVITLVVFRRQLSTRHEL